MKKAIVLCLLLLCISCNEDRSVDPSIMPEATTVGKNTFGCLIDDWVYISQRWGTPKVHYIAVEDSTAITIEAKVGFTSVIKLTLINPTEGEIVEYKDVLFENQKFENGQALITRMSDGIISGTFEGKRIVKGRFDLKYSEPIEGE